MNKYISLVKVLLKTSNENLTNSKKRSKTIILYSLLLLALVPFMFQIGSMTGYLYDSLSRINQEGMILALALAVTSLSIMILGVLYVINVFYFSSDIEYLLPLPLKPSLILSGKFTVTVIYEYIIEAMFLFPVFIKYGIKSGAGILYYMYSLIVFLFTPVVPLILSSIIVIIIMRFTNIAKNKDRFKMISGFFAMFLALGVNLAVQKLVGRSNVDIQQIITSGDNSYINIISNIFPTIRFSSLALTNSYNIKGLLYFLSFLVINAVLFSAFLFIGEKIYFKGVVGLSQSSSKRKKYEEEELRKVIVRKSPLMSYTLKEIKMLIRTPIYFLNCVIINFLWPVFLIIPMILQPESKDAIPIVSNILRNSDNLGIVIGGVAAGALFISSANGITSTSISREGQNVYFNKFIPLNYNIIIMAKVLSGALFSFVGLLLSFIIFYVVLKPTVNIIILSILASIFAIILASLMGITIDLNFPKLNWDSEQKAVKQNFNVLINMVVNVIFAVITIKTINAFKLDGLSVFFFIIVLYSVISLLLYLYLKRNVNKIFEGITN
ncbi:putative ABC transporter permease subunit [uncultured Clostridium sp.]|uniref:putative ABC transporter permease subunit n=1 Tax=uncultured Clostridium sp. TaxID=59620 RepID=UPI0028E34E1C|nr:hypothetical protein [uncultured Clostridium sp.]